MMKPLGNKGILLEANLWYWREVFLKRTIFADGKGSWAVYGKYHEKKLQDFWFEASSILAIKDAMDLFQEKIEHKIVPELHPDFNELEGPNA